MRSFRKPGRYKRNLHSTYCREHPLVKSLSNIYPCLLKGLSLIAREVSSKKGNNIPFITSNFRKKKRVRGEAATLCFTSLFTLVIVSTVSTFYDFEFITAHFQSPSIHFIIRSFVIRTSFVQFPFSPHYYILPATVFSISFPSFLFSSTFIAFSPRQAPRLSTNSNVALFLIIPPRTKGDIIGRNKSKEISSARSV